jgi:hypothetical protein
VINATLHFGRDHGSGVIGLELEGAATDVRGIDDPGLKAKIFRNAKAADALIAAGVIDGINIAPTQASVFWRLRGGLSFDLQRLMPGATRRGIRRSQRRRRLFAAAYATPFQVRTCRHRIRRHVSIGA